MFVMPNGMLKSNQQLVDIIEKVKPEIRLLIEKCNTVSLEQGEAEGWFYSCRGGVVGGAGPSVLQMRKGRALSCVPGLGELCGSPEGQGCLISGLRRLCLALLLPRHKLLPGAPVAW